MWPKHLLTSALVAMGLAGLAACGRVESEAAAPQAQPTVATPQVISSGPDAPPGPAPAGDQSAPGEAPAGAALDPLGQAPGEAAGAAQEVGPMTSYTDPTFGFRLAYPTSFVLRPRPAEALAQLAPAPTAGIAFLSPALATSDLDELELPDLELRVHATGGAATLEAWLGTNSLLPAGGAQALTPFQTAEATGAELCGDTMLAPGCSYYFLGDGYVYQLIPSTLEGEAILRTFAPT